MAGEAEAASPRACDSDRAHREANRHPGPRSPPAAASSSRRRRGSTAVPPRAAPRPPRRQAPADTHPPPVTRRFSRNRCRRGPSRKTPHSTRREGSGRFFRHGWPAPWRPGGPAERPGRPAPAVRRHLPPLLRDWGVCSVPTHVGVRMGVIEL